jgi:hypothetical protein
VAGWSYCKCGGCLSRGVGRGKVTVGIVMWVKGWISGYGCGKVAVGMVM